MDSGRMPIGGSVALYDGEPMKRHQTQIWEPTRKSGVECAGCGKVGTCTMSADGKAFKCWRNDGQIFKRGHTPIRAITATTSHKTSKTFATADLAIAAARRGVSAGCKLGKSFHYQNAVGDLVMIVARFEGQNGKEFRPIHLASGRWKIGDPPGPLPLYRLPKILAAPSDPVFVCEGEKATKAARAIGLNATTSAHGSSSAAKSDWGSLAGREVVILPDNDAPGEHYGHEVAKELMALNPPPKIKIVRLRGLPAGGDIVEYLAAGGTRKDIEAMVHDAPLVDAADFLGGLVTRKMSSIQSEELQWLWKDRIPLGKLTVFAGDPGLGKSFLTLDIAARTSKGRLFSDGAKCERGNVLLVSAEDDPGDTIRPRLDAMRADTSRIGIVDCIQEPDQKERGFCLADVPQLDNELSRNSRYRLVVIDPVSAYLGGTDSHVNSDVRGLLAPLAKIAAKRKVAIILVTHLSKSAGGNALYRAMGSLAFVAAARAVWMVTKDRMNPSRRLFLPAKNNLTKDGTGLAFEIQSGIVVWESEPIAISADEALGDSSTPGPEPIKRREAEEYLRGALRHGPRQAKDLEAEASARGLSWSGAVREASRILAIDKCKKNIQSGWVWSLPVVSKVSNSYRRHTTNLSNSSNTSNRKQDELDVLDVFVERAGRNTHNKANSNTDGDVLRGKLHTAHRNGRD